VTLNVIKQNRKTNSLLGKHFSPSLICLARVCNISVHPDSVMRSLRIRVHEFIRIQSFLPYTTRASKRTYAKLPGTSKILEHRKYNICLNFLLFPSLNFRLSDKCRKICANRSEYYCLERNKYKKNIFIWKISRARDAILLIECVSHYFWAMIYYNFHLTYTSNDFVEYLP